MKLELRLLAVLLLCLLGLCLPGNASTDSPQDDEQTTDDDSTTIDSSDADTTTTGSGPGQCIVLALEDLIDEQVAELLSAGTKLIKYDITFPEYNRSPVFSNSSQLYRPDQWQRVIGEHGRTLLSLAFNYDVLSLRMLTFGVVIRAIELQDHPRHCLGSLPLNVARRKINELILRDFKRRDVFTIEERDVNDNFVCQQVVTDDDGYGLFEYDCCRFVSSTNLTTYCLPDVEKDKWIDLMYALILCIKFGFLLLGPLILHRWIYYRSIRTADYRVKLDAPLRRTLVVRKVKDAKGVKKSSFDDSMQDQFIYFRSLVKKLPSNEVVPINVNSMHVQIQLKELLTERSVPAGLFYFIWTNFFQCGLTRYEPFASCCKESILGSWEKSFLWLKLSPGGSDCNRCCRKYMSFGHFISIIGVFVLITAVAMPFAIRIAIYYKYEEPEIIRRKEALEEFGLHEQIGKNLLHYLTPTHPLSLMLYGCYFGSFTLLSLCKRIRNDVFEEVILGSLLDLRSISRVECLRLLLSHLLLPFEKFGLCGGVIVGVVYWTFAIPLCFVTILWYCVPTFYLIGRLTIQSRPSFVRFSAVPFMARGPNPAKQWALKSLSLGITSIESCMMLKNISPRRSLIVEPEPQSIIPCIDHISTQTFCKQVFKVRLKIDVFKSWVVTYACIILFCLHAGGAWAGGCRLDALRSHLLRGVRRFRGRSFRHDAHGRRGQRRNGRKLRHAWLLGAHLFHRMLQRLVQPIHGAQPQDLYASA